MPLSTLLCKVICIKKVSKLVIYIAPEENQLDTIITTTAVEVFMIKATNTIVVIVVVDCLVDEAAAAAVAALVQDGVRMSPSAVWLIQLTSAKRLYIHLDSPHR